MRSIAVYGSLIDKEEMQDVFPDSHSDSFRVKIRNFSRSYNQKATWRDGENEESGTLTAFPMKNEWINAIIIPRVSQDEYESYKDREEGYKLESVDLEDIEPYYGSPVELEELSVSIAVGQLWLDDAEPIPEYKELCLEGASQWGERFLEDFVKTTKKSVGKPKTEVEKKIKKASD